MSTSTTNVSHWGKREGLMRYNAQVITRVFIRIFFAIYKLLFMDRNNASKVEQWT